MKNYYSVGFLAVGIFIGWLFWGADTMGNRQLSGGVHRMPGGDVMMDMDHMMNEMNAGLIGKTGDEFDREFLEEMIVHHQGAIDMAELVLSTSKRPELINLAGDIIEAQTGEIEMMQGWLESWY